MRKINSGRAKTGEKREKTVSSKNSVTEVEKKSQNFLVLFFDDLTENFWRLRHMPWFVFGGVTCYVYLVHRKL
jgi:hypothetical protein